MGRLRLDRISSWFLGIGNGLLIFDSQFSMFNYRNIISKRILKNKISSISKGILLVIKTFMCHLERRFIPESRFVSPGLIRAPGTDKKMLKRLNCHPECVILSEGVCPSRNLGLSFNEDLGSEQSELDLFRDLHRPT